MQINKTFLYLTRIFLDITILIFTFILSAYLSVSNYNFFNNVNGQFLLLLLCVIWVSSSRSTKLYDDFRSRNFSHELIPLLRNIFIQIISAIIILFLLKEYRLSRQFIILFSIILLVSIGFEKLILRRIINSFRSKGRNLRNLVIIGAGEVGKNFYDSIYNNPHFGYKIIGFLDDKQKTFLNGKYLGKIEELNAILSKQQIDDVIVALPNYATDKLEEVVKTCENHTTRIKIIPDYFRFVSNKYSISVFDKFPIISVREERINELHCRILKRAFDFTFTSLLFLFVFSWLWPLIALCIKISSPGTIFYIQERWGRNNKKIRAYKFRSMEVFCSDVDKNGKYQQACKNDPRITKIGKSLRKTNLDELPQFWNVLKGEMSIVGPRPHPTQLNLESKDKVHLYMLRHLVKPGLTGWAQVNGYRGETRDISKMQKRIDHDIWYIENWSFWLDLQIIAQTMWIMIKGDPNAY
ncbi:MAG: undecaprenyl-phosphate glucose phosphotransferase [Ignavibacteriales bacterium CG_4_9_14_3_um_filter_30_11]|nr:MAG: undecaprenyl-phosphate glucose phosphotransferase [Ignavibacteriales bacterium CG_4_9_14_3_um_filter_30_11]